MKDVSTCGTRHSGSGSLRTWASNRKVLLLGAGALLAVAAVAGWPWLAATGLASLLIGLAPCLIMCGLGLCMMHACKKKGQVQEAGKASPAAVPADPGVTPPPIHASMGEAGNPARTTGFDEPKRLPA